MKKPFPPSFILNKDTECAIRIDIAIRKYVSYLFRSYAEERTYLERVDMPLYLDSMFNSPSPAQYKKEK